MALIFKDIYLRAREKAFYYAFYDFIFLFGAAIFGLLQPRDVPPQWYYAQETTGNTTLTDDEDTQQTTPQIPIRLNNATSGDLYNILYARERLPVDQLQFLCIMLHSCRPFVSGLLVFSIVMIYNLMNGLRKKQIKLLVTWLAFQIVTLALLATIFVLSMAMTITISKGAIFLFLTLIIYRFLVTSTVYCVTKDIFHELYLHGSISTQPPVKDDSSAPVHAPEIDSDNNSEDSGHAEEESEICNNGYPNIFYDVSINVNEYDFSSAVFQLPSVENSDDVVVDCSCEFCENQVKPEPVMKFIPGVGVETPV